MTSLHAHPRVLGVGWPRTGTTTLRRALVALGFAPCDHMLELSASPARVAGWEALERGDAGAAHALFAGWGAAVDNPTCVFWRELTDAFPDARVVLTVRDPGEWHASYLDAIHANTFERPRPDGDIGRVVDLLRRRWVDGALRGAPRDRDVCTRAFTEHVREVRAALGDRALVMEPSDGWEPLCAHLGVGVPPLPWPHANTRAYVAEHGVHER